MTHDEVEAARSRAIKAATHMAAAGSQMAAVRENPESYPVTASALDVPALLAYVDELRGVLHDLRQEPGYELGRREERGEVLALLQQLAAEWERPFCQPETALRVAATKIAGRGPLAPHLAPDDLRRENAELRAALADVLYAAGRDTNVRWAGSHVGDALEAARRLLGDRV